MDNPEFFQQLKSYASGAFLNPSIQDKENCCSNITQMLSSLTPEQTSSQSDEMVKILAPIISVYGGIDAIVDGLKEKNSELMQAILVQGVRDVAQPTTDASKQRMTIEEQIPLVDPSNAELFIASVRFVEQNADNKYPKAAANLSDSLSKEPITWSEQLNGIRSLIKEECQSEKNNFVQKYNNSLINGLETVVSTKARDAAEEAENLLKPKKALNFKPSTFEGRGGEGGTHYVERGSEREIATVKAKTQFKENVTVVTDMPSLGDHISSLTDEKKETEANLKKCNSTYKDALLNKISEIFYLMGIFKEQPIHMQLQKKIKDFDNQISLCKSQLDNSKRFLELDVNPKHSVNPGKDFSQLTAVMHNASSISLSSGAVAKLSKEIPTPILKKIK